MNRVNELADLLLELEKELRGLKLWQDARPSAEAFESQNPFAADQLSIDQWLQWIFLPQIKIIIESNGSIPSRCDISPYAEESLKNSNPAPVKLLRIILEIDRTITSA